MNVLIFFLSLIKGDPAEIEYKAPNQKIYKGKQTNEAAAKYLLAKLSDSGERLGKIIAVTSREAEENGLQRFSSGIKEFCDNYPDINFDVLKNFKTIPNYSDNEPLDDEDVLANVLKEISPKDTVYLDVSGGKRTDVNMMLLLMKLVKYKGIKVADAFYSDHNGTISSHSGFYRSLDILDGVNQFVTTGNAVQLAECYSSIPEESSVKKLLAAMVDFSDSVNLCSLLGIDKTLTDMKSLIDEISGSDEGGMDMFLFREIIPIIREKFFGSGGSPDYCQIILWCLDNRLIQQAVTLYVEKIPKHFFVKGLLSFTEKSKNDNNSGKKPGEPNNEKDLFFSSLMSCDSLSAEEKEKKRLPEELKKWLEAKIKYQDYEPENEAVRAAAKTIESFCHLKPTDLNTSLNTCGEVVDHILENKSKYDDRLVKFAKALTKNTSCRSSKVGKIYNIIKNDGYILSKFFPLKKSEKTTEQKKVNTIRKALEMTIPDGFSVNISREELQKIMAYYFYARQMRNRINHAVDSKNESDETAEMLKEFFEEFGIDYDSFSMDEIKSQLRKSVEYILDLKPQKQN